MVSEADKAYEFILKQSIKYNHSKLHRFISSHEKVSLNQNKNQTLSLFLIKTVISQQVSTSAAKTIWNRFEKVLESKKGKKLTKKDIASAGISNQKSEYILGILNNNFIQSTSLDELKEYSLEDLNRTLLTIKGIGPWTLGITRMFYICDSDVWLEGDLGIKKATEIFLQELDNDDISRIYSPYRTFLSLYLWRGLDSF